MKTLPMASIIALGIVLAASGYVYAGEGSASSGHMTSGGFDYSHHVLVVSIPNHLTKKQARRRVDKALSDLQRDYGYLFTIERKRWTGDQLQLRADVLGQAAIGRIDVTRTHVSIRVWLPGSLAFLVDAAQPAILKAGTQMLAQK